MMHERDALLMLACVSITACGLGCGAAGGPDLNAPFPGGRIAGISADDFENVYRVWVMNADATGFQWVSAKGAYDLGCQWSPNGTMLAFSSSSPEATVVYEQGRRRPLFGSSHVFAWSPDSRRLAVASGGNVSVGHADGSEAHVVCTPEGGAESLSWAPDNRTILYSTYDGELYTIRDDGTELQHIRSNAYLAAMSPDGTRVTYATGGGQQANPPMMMVLATGQETRLSEYPVSSIYEDPWRPWWPRFFWSPDSKYVMFGTYDGGDVYIVSRDGELALSIAGGGLPTWLPDGEHVAYLTIRGTTEFWIRVMDLSGSVTRTLVLPDEIKQTADYIFWSQR